MYDGICPEAKIAEDVKIGPECLIKKAFLILFRPGLNAKQAVKKLWENFKYSEDIKHIAGFINKPERGRVK